MAKPIVDNLLSDHFAFCVRLFHRPIRYLFVYLTDLTDGSADNIFPCPRSMTLPIGFPFMFVDQMVFPLSGSILKK